MRLPEYSQVKAVLLARGPTEQTLKELDSVYTQAGDELTPEQISDITKVLPVIFGSALDDDENVRKTALSILTKLAKALEQNQYLKNGAGWSEVKACIMKSLPKLTIFLENGVKEWCEVWCVIVHLYGSQLISDTGSINSLLKIVEKAFKMKGDQVRLVGFTCWNALIDNFSLVAPETNSRYLNLILIPLKALNHGNKVLCHAKLETWKHLIKQIEHNDANIKQALPSFLLFLFEEVGTLAPACHHFPEETAHCFLDIIKKPNMFRIVPDTCIKYATKCIVSISSNSSQVQRVWNTLLDGLKIFLWPDDLTFELVNTLKELNYKIDNQTVFARIVISTLNGASAMPVRVQCRHFETLVMFVLTAEYLQEINESDLLHFLDILRSTNQVHINLFKDMLDSLIRISNKKISSSSKESANSSLLKSMRSVWLTLASTVTDWFKSGGNLSQNEDKVTEEVNFIHMLLMCGCANLSSKWNKRMLKHWKELYSESYKNFILHPVIQQNQIIVDFVNLLLTGLQSDKISLLVAIDVASVLLEIHHSADTENLMPYLLEIIEGAIKVLRDDIPSGMAVINQYLSVLLNAATNYYSLVPHITVITEKMSNFKQDLPALNMRIYNKIMKVHLQVLAMKQPDKSEVRPSSPTVTSFMHRLAKAKQNLSQKMAVSPLRERSLTPQLTKSPGKTSSPPTKSPNQRHSKIAGDSQIFVMIPPKPRTTPLTERQKEQLFTRSDNIPALYQDLSQDTQSQSNIFEGLVSSFENKKNSGHFLSPIRQLETDANKSSGVPESDNNLLKVADDSSYKSNAIEKSNDTVNLGEKSKVVLISKENKVVNEIEINASDKNTTQSTEVAVDNKNSHEVKKSVESKDLLDKKRKSEQNLKVKDDNKNMRNTLNKDNVALKRTSESSSSDNVRITRSASKPKGMRRSISLPVMGLQSDTNSSRKSDLKVNKDTSEKTPRCRKRKQERGSSAEPRSTSKKERLSRNNLNVSVNERRVTRQFSESISMPDLGDGDKHNLNGIQRSENLVEKNFSERRVTRQFSESISIPGLGDGDKHNTNGVQKSENLVEKNVSERRVTRQFSEIISMQCLGDGDEVNTDDIQKSENLVEKNVNGRRIAHQFSESISMQCLGDGDEVNTDDIQKSENLVEKNVNGRRITRQFSESISMQCLGDGDEVNTDDIQKSENLVEKNVNGRITRQFSESINMHGLGDVDEVNTNDIQKSETLVEKTASGVVNDSIEYHDTISKSKRRRYRRKSILNSGLNMKETRKVDSNKDAELIIKTIETERSSEEKKTKNVNLLSNPCNNKESFSVLEVNKIVVSGKTDINSKKSRAIIEGNHFNVECKDQLAINELNNSENKSIESSEESRPELAVIGKDDVNLKDNENNVEETKSEDTLIVRPAMVTVDQCDEKLCSVDQNHLQMEKIDGNSNIQSVNRELRGSSVTKPYENGKKLVILLESIETDKTEMIGKELYTNNFNLNQSKNAVNKGPFEKSGAVQQGTETKIPNNMNKSIYDNVINKEIKVILERSPVKQGTTYVTSKLVSPIKVRKLDISGDLVTATPKKNMATIEPAGVEINATAKTLGDSPHKNKVTTVSALKEESTATKTSSDSQQKNKTTVESALVEVSETTETSGDSLQKNKETTGSVFEGGSTVKTSLDIPQNKTTVELAHVKESVTTNTKSASPPKTKETTESADVKESTTPKMSSGIPYKSKVTTESGVVEGNSQRIEERSVEEAMRSDFSLHVEVDSVYETSIESTNKNTEICKKTDSNNLNSVTLENTTNDIHKHEPPEIIIKSETKKIQEFCANQNQKCEGSHKKAKVAHRKNAENLLSPSYNKKSSDPKKQTTLTTLNKWILRTPTKELSSEDADSFDTNQNEIDILKESKSESQDMLESQDIIESSQESLSKEVKNCGIMPDKIHSNQEHEKYAKANCSIVLQNLFRNSELETDTKLISNCNVVVGQVHKKREQEADVGINLLTKTRVSCSSPVTNVGLTPLLESAKNVNHIQKCTPTKKSVCRRLDKEIEGMYKLNNVEQTEKENCVGLCKCKYTSKLETLPINPAFQVDTSIVCCGPSKSSSQQFLDSQVTNNECNAELIQRKPDINFAKFGNDDDSDDDDIFDLKRPRKAVDSEKQVDTNSFYFVGRPITRNFIESHSNAAVKNGSPVHRRSLPVKENGSPLCRTIGETNGNGSPVIRKLESPTKNGSPPNSRILKNEIQVSPRSRTAHLIELAKQDPTGIRNFYSPVKLGSAKAQRVRPIRLLGNDELSSVDIGGAKEDWVCHTYSPLASPNTSILKRKICETPDIITPNTKRKRVSFCDPPVSESLVFSNNEHGKGQIQRPEQKKDLNSYIEVDNSEMEAASNDPIFPPLESCRHPVTKVLEKFISSHWLDQMETSLEKINIHTVGDFSIMSESTVYKLMCSSFKLEMLKQALQEYCDSTSTEDFPHSKKSALLDTELIDNDLQGIAALPSESPENKQDKHVKFTELHKEMSEQNFDKISLDNIVSEIEKNPDIANDLGNKLDFDIIMKMLASAANKLKHSHT